MGTFEVVVFVVASLFVGAIGFFLGRIFSPTNQMVEDLNRRLETQIKERRELDRAHQALRESKDGEIRGLRQSLSAANLLNKSQTERIRELSEKIAELAKGRVRPRAPGAPERPGVPTGTTPADVERAAAAAALADDDDVSRGADPTLPFTTMGDVED